jgi:hypothetical protein
MVLDFSHRGILWVIAMYDYVIEMPPYSMGSGVVLGSRILDWLKGYYGITTNATVMYDREDVFQKYFRYMPTWRLTNTESVLFPEFSVVLLTFQFMGLRMEFREVVLATVEDELMAVQMKLELE